jgi:hypothetical protein
VHGQNAASGAYIVYMDETLLVGHTVHIWTESYHWGILYMTESYEKDILFMDTTLLVGHTVGYLQEQNPIGMVRHTVHGQNSSS